MTLSKKILLSKYKQFLLYLIPFKKPSKNFYTVVSENKKSVLNIIKSTQYLYLVIKFLKVEYRKKEHFLFHISPYQELYFKFHYARKNYSYLSQRWLGGLLTNYFTISKTLNNYDTSFSNIKATKKEINTIKKKKEKIIYLFEGLNNLNKLPTAVIFLNNKNNNFAIKECLSLGIIPITLVNITRKTFVSPYILPITQNSLKFSEFFLKEIFD